MERRAPHKSMHCEFCKPPGAVVADQGAQPAQLETKTKLHLTHERADLKIFDVADEPGVAAVESEACVCQLESYHPCSKCAPDKNWRPRKKKVCDCPPGSRPHPNMADMFGKNEKKKKKSDDYQEFWWEKYDREHDAIAKETWAAYMAQRRQDKKLLKALEVAGAKESTVMKPKWYQKLSSQQVLYLEYLSTAIRLDLDENITDRTFFVLGGIGLFPRPKKKVLQKCLRFCHYNAIRFLNQLFMLIQDEDPFHERPQKTKAIGDSKWVYAWNDRIVMSCICYLEFPNLLREIMDRLPPLPQDKLLPPIPKPKFPKPPVREYASPYDEPLWRERLNWVEKQKIERINRARKHMDTKRVKIPYLALVRRPSLIDARPPFLSQIEATQSFHRRRKPSKKYIQVFRKKKKATFDSKVDITAIAGIEASEVSTTPKADSEDICMFLREKRPKSDFLQVELEDDDFVEEFEEEEFREVNTLVPIDLTSVKATDRQSIKTDVETLGEGELLIEQSTTLDDEDSIPFVTPPKTESGATIQTPCPPPETSPGPPASHYDMAKRELGIINQEMCQFDPNKMRSRDDDTVPDGTTAHIIDVEGQLLQVAKKLQELNTDGVLEDNQKKKRKKKKSKKSKKKKKRSKKLPKDEEILDTGKSTDGTSIKTPLQLDMGFKEGQEQWDQGTEEFIETEEELSGADSSNSCVCRVIEKTDDNIPCLVKEKKMKKKGKKSKRKKSSKRTCKKEDDRKSGKNSKKLKKMKAAKRAKKKPAVKTECSKTDGDDHEPCPFPGESDEDKIFYGEVEPLLRNILRDLNDEGYISAGYSDIDEHPDIKQLIKHLQGEIVSEKTKKYLDLLTKGFWKDLEKRGKPTSPVPNLNISSQKLENATWMDKKWIANLARKKKDEFYFNVAKNRSTEAKDFYLTLFQQYFGTDRFLNAYYAYMIAKQSDCVLKGLP